MPQNDNDTIVFLQFHQTGLYDFGHPVCIKLFLRVILDGNVFIGEGLLISRPIPLIDRFIDRYPVNPAEKFVFRVVLIKPFKCTQKDDLCHICCIVRVTENPISGIVNGPFVILDQLSQCFPVSTLTSQDECTIPIITHNY